MFNKIYEYIKKILKGNYKSIVFILCFLIVATYPVPYYIFTSGGITDLNERFEIENQTKQKGSYNLSYVTQIEGNVLTYLASYIIPDWETVKVEAYQVSNTESLEELALRDQLSLLQANQTAVKLAYDAAGKNFTIDKRNLYIIYMTEYFESDTKVKVGDRVVKADDKEIATFDDLSEILNNKNVGETIKFELSRGEETIIANIKVQEVEGAKLTGIALYEIFDYSTDPKIIFNFSARESGASAGLMTTLAIYDSLIEEDLTKGYKIAGTGQIFTDGTVGEIGGVKYKLRGAVAKKADIFLVPTGSNYEECIKLKKENNYKIEIVEITTLNDAIEYLKSIKKEKE